MKAARWPVAVSATLFLECDVKLFSDKTSVYFWWGLFFDFFLGGG